MNTTILAVGAGGILLGGVGGFVIANGGSGSDAVSQGELAETRSNSTVVVSSGSSSSGNEAPVRDLREVFSEPSQTERMQKLLDYYSSLSPDMYEDEAGKLNDLPFSERILASYLLFSQWAETDPEGALAHSDKMGRGGFFVKPTILQGWAGSDPEAAAQYLADNPREFAMMDMMGRRGGPGGNGSAGTIAKEWARQDPDAAMAWAKGLSGQQGIDAVTGVIAEIAANDPVEAVNMARGLPADQQAEVNQAIAREWGGEDWSAMKAWASSLPADQRERALSEGLEGYANVDPQGAAREALTFAEGNSRDEGIETAVEAWSREDPMAAFDFVVTNGSEEAQEDAMRDVMGSLARTDPEAGRNRIDTLPDGEVRDSAVGTYVFSVEEGDNEELITLAATIGDDRDRERSVSMATQRWLMEDPEAAGEFLDNTDLMTPEAVQDIRERAESGRFFGRGRGGRR